MSVKPKVLITGGAGFIGSHLADELLKAGYEVRVLDNLLAQVHGSMRRRPAYLSTDVEFLEGDIRDSGIVRQALTGVRAVFHLAAAVGVGQSMYEMKHYTSINTLGTAVLLESIIDGPVEKLIVASSMSIYGEGRYADADGRMVPGVPRSVAQLRSGRWDTLDGQSRPLVPVPTDESKAPNIWSIYALGKHDQEQMALMVGRTYGFGVVALRLFNVFGARQALSNPYTGVLAIFASRLLNDKPPLIFEDGLQRRDFVSVHDIARAMRMALESPAADGHVLNIGSGRSYTIRQVAERLAQSMDKSIQPVLTGKYRTGDVRHCFADISKAERLLGYTPRFYLEENLAELADWLRGQIAVDHVERATLELEKRGLTI
jgi:dTDP-L-rhamnose 4-epimerase